jgi:hypothetical protein
LNPTAPGWTVAANEDETVLEGKYEIKKGQTVLVVLDALHKDPAVWGEDADEFRSVPRTVEHPGIRWEFFEASIEHSFRTVTKNRVKTSVCSTVLGTDRNSSASSPHTAGSLCSERMLDGGFEKLPPDSWKPFGRQTRRRLGLESGSDDLFYCQATV